MAVIIDGLTYASWLFIIAVGLTLIYGVMKILNIAHGSLYSLGAYGAAYFGGLWLNGGMPIYLVFLVMFITSIFIGILFGAIIERGILKRMYDKDEIVLVLVTYAIFLILEDLIKLIWGVDPYFLYQPYGMLGSFTITDLTYPNYNILLFASAIVIGLIITYVLKNTIKGKILLAVIHDRELSLSQGVNVSFVYFLTFIIGASLGAIGGALTAPMISVQPGIGAESIVLAFAVVVIGGLGSLPGAAIAALLVGFVKAAAIHFMPELDLFSVYIVMAGVLIFRPKGIFSGHEARKI